MCNEHIPNVAQSHFEIYFRDEIANLIYISVSMGCSITKALLLYIAVNFPACKMQDVAATARRLSTDFENSTVVVNGSPLDQNTSVPTKVFQRCVHGKDKLVRRLFNCNLTYLHPRAFVDWPKVEVRKYKIVPNLNNVSVVLHSAQVIAIHMAQALSRTKHAGNYPLNHGY